MRALWTHQQRGVVLLAVLVFVLISTLGASSLIQMHQTQTQRDKEEQLLFVGDQYRRAIASYYNTIPTGGARSLPKSLEDLVNDDRFPTPLHHLRRMYPDPMTGQADWQLIREGAGIRGIGSQSKETTLKKSGFSKEDKLFEAMDLYSDWKFVIPPQVNGSMTR